MSVGLGDQRVRLRKKTISLGRIGRFRCTGYQLIFESVHAAAQALR